MCIRDRNSCDSGREGELIFRLVYQQAGCKKPFSRLWLSSMEESAIREGFAHIKPSTEYDALCNAALCRERADWMVGINASRDVYKRQFIACYELIEMITQHNNMAQFEPALIMRWILDVYKRQV